LERRAEILKLRVPDLIAVVTLYDTALGGRQGPALPGYGCPCVLSREPPRQGYDVWFQLGDEPMFPGEQRRVGMVFLDPDTVAILAKAEKFFLWETKLVGEGYPVT
jgi:hypothetical protein